MEAIERQCPICPAKGAVSRAAFRRHIREAHGAKYWNEHFKKHGRVIARNHALRNPGKDYPKVSASR